MQSPTTLEQEDVNLHPHILRVPRGVSEDLDLAIRNKDTIDWDYCSKVPRFAAAGAAFDAIPASHAVHSGAELSLRDSAHIDGPIRLTCCPLIFEPLVWLAYVEWISDGFRSWPPGLIYIHYTYSGLTWYNQILSPSSDSRILTYANYLHLRLSRIICPADGQKRRV